MTDTVLTELDAQMMQDTDPNIIWIITKSADHFVARPHTSSHGMGEHALDFVLLAPSLEDLQRSLPRNMTKFQREPFWAPETLEVWGVP